jgi:hypothetical protein
MAGLFFPAAGRGRINMNLLMAPRKWMLLAVALAAGVNSPLPAQPPPAAAAPEAGRIVEVRVVARKPEGGVRTVRARKGETLVLKVRSDEKLEVHVHGYDLHQAVVPGAVASLPIAARWVGRFPVTVHLAEGGSGRHAEPTLLYLEVHPE